MGLQAKQIELQQKNVESQIALNMATASKTEAEAKKIAGVDTEGQELQNKWQEIENRIQLSRKSKELTGARTSGGVCGLIRRNAKNLTRA